PTTTTPATQTQVKSLLSKKLALSLPLHTRSFSDPSPTSSITTTTTTTTITASPGASPDSDPTISSSSSSSTFGRSGGSGWETSPTSDDVSDSLSPLTVKPGGEKTNGEGEPFSPAS